MIRFLVYGIPCLLVALIVAAFINASFVSTKKRNEMSIGTLGEPTTLNPIQAADAASSQVTSLLFGSLLKFDENLEIVPSLARTWSMEQTSTFFLKDAAAARAAVAVLEEAAVKHPEWTLEQVALASPDSNVVLLRFQLPGLNATRAAAGLLPEDAWLPLHEVKVAQTSGAAESLREFLEQHPDLPVVRSWVENSARYELTLAGDPEKAKQALLDYYSSQTGTEAEVAVGDSLPFLAEPSLVFQLREDVRWHDGIPFTSEDVLFTYRAIMSDEVASPRKSDFDLILRMEANGPGEVRVTYRKPFSPALNSWMISILPAHILADRPVTWWAENFNRNPVGLGPFRFSEWKTNEYIRLERNPDYYLAPGPWLDSVVFRVLPDPLTLRLAFETRQVDFWAADPWAVSAFQDDERFQVFTAPTNSYTYVGWNLRRPLFQDESTRIALAHAVNIPQMIRYILYGNGVQSTGIFTPELWFFNPEVQPYEYDTVKAAALLAEAGWKRGRDGVLARNGERLSFTLVLNNGNEVRRDIATLVQDDLRRLGIEVRVEMYEWAVFIKNFINQGEFDACVLGWSLSRDFDQFQLWHSSQAGPEQLNFVGYKNPEVDRLLEEIRQEYDRNEIIRMAGAIQQIIYREQPYLFLFVPESTSVMWTDTYRICRPDGKGGWIESPVEMTKAGWSYFLEWFYRPDHLDHLPEEVRAGEGNP